jgi:hypothetical protein
MSLSVLTDAKTRVAMVSALRTQRKRAIDVCDFPKAKIIDVQIKRITAYSDETNTLQQGIQNQAEYDRAKESVRMEAAKTYSNAIERIYHIESEFQGRAARLIAEHAEELTAHATALAAELELSSIRPVPDSVVLKNEAQILARFGDFDRAQSLFEGSTNVHEQTVSARHADVRDVYERLQRQLDARHVEELRLNDEKKAGKIREIILAYDKVIDRLKKQLVNAAFKFQVNRNEEEEAEFFLEVNSNALQIPAEKAPSRAGSESSGTSPRPKSAGSPREKALRAARPHAGGAARTASRPRLSPRGSQT